MDFDLKPDGSGLGAAVTGIDLRAAIDEVTARNLNAALLAHPVLCVRGPVMSPERFTEASKIFGDPQIQLLGEYRLDDVPEVTIISNYNAMAGGKPHVRATYWHTDDSYLAVPAKATLLHAVALPSRGGDTLFIDCRRVLDEMPDALRARVEGRSAVHVYRSRRGKAIVAERSKEEVEESPDVVHPLVRTHPETGRQSLYINPNRIDHMADMDLEEGDALLDEVYAFAFQEKFQSRHQWQLGDMVIWDNRCTMHRASDDFDITERREFHRILLKGTAPV